MQGLMQDYPLTLPHIFHRAERLFPDKEIVTSLPTGRERITYGDWAVRTRKLGGVLNDLGISPDGRVGTFSWNTARHLELYFAAPCTGRVLHTLNLRLFPEQVTYIVNHAEDEVIFVDKTVAGLLWPLLPTFETVRHIVVIDDGGPFDTSEVPDGIELHDYEELLAAASPVEFHVEDENLAASMCYTSGTTGNPKGVVYSHRSTMLHTMAAMFADGFGARESDRILPVVPMFHANAWGLAHAAVAVGADLVMPGPNLAPEPLAELIESEKVTVAAGVPTIWMGVLPALKGRDTSALRVIPCGGSAVPKALSEAFREQLGLPIYQAWGMTETSPVATVGEIKSKLRDLPEEELADIRAMQGLPLFGVELRVLSQEDGSPVPWDGEARGELQAAGPWIAREYYNDDRSPESFTDDGWLRTTATSSSSTAPRTWSRAAASGSARWSWRTRSWPTRPWPKLPSSASPTPSGRSARWPAWSSRRASPSPRRTSWSSSTVASPSGGSPTTSSSSTRSPRPASASSPRRTCAPASRATSSRPPITDPGGHRNRSAPSSPVGSAISKSSWAKKSALESSIPRASARSSPMSARSAKASS